MSDEETLKSEVMKVVQALNDGDVDWISQHYLPEVTRFHQRGQLDIGWSDSKADEMRQFLAAGMCFEISDVDVVDVRVYGNTGITVGHLQSRLVVPGIDDVIGAARFTYVWVKTNGSWKEVHHHISDLHEWGT